MGTEGQRTQRAAASTAAVGATAHKVLNNNVVIVVDPGGRERVLMGRGLAFGLKPSDPIDPEKVQKTFVLDDGEGAEHELRLLSEVSYTVLEAVTAAVDGAERMLGRALGRSFTIAVIDHIEFLLQRLDDGVRIPAASMPQLRVLHPQESKAADAMSAALSQALGRDLPPEEGVFLTMHLLNATRDEPNGTAALLFRRVQHVVTTVENGLGVTLDVDSLDYARFILHVQFLLQRLVTRTMLRSGDTSFFEFAKHSYPASFQIAVDVKDYVLAATGSELTDEELLYLVVHVERLASQLRSASDGGQGDDPVLA